MKRISIEAWSYFFNQYSCDVELFTSDNNSLCKECAYIFCTQTQEVQRQRDAKENIITLISDSSSEKKFWLSTDWYTEWKKFYPGSVEKINTKPNIGLICIHEQFDPSADKIAISDTAWKTLYTLYPAAIVFEHNHSECLECLRAIELENQIRDQIKAERAVEKKEFQDLIKVNHEPQPGTWYLLPVIWHQKWKEYLDNCNIEKPPGVIDIGRFICKHGGAVLDMANIKHIAELVFLNEDQWIRLTKRYNSSSEIKFDYTNKKNNELTPKPCKECLEEREKIEKEALMQFMEKEVQVVCTTAPVESNFQIATVRRSKRRNKESYAKVVCSAIDTVGILKLKIYQATEIPPGCQSLWIEDRPLDRDDFTLFMYELTPESTIRLHQVEGTGYIDMDVIEPKWANQKEEGFKGTNLYSSPKVSTEDDEEEDDTDDGDSDAEDKEKEKEKEKERSPMEVDTNNIKITDEIETWQCPACTFAGNTTKNCDVCGAAKSKQDDSWRCNACTFINSSEDKECSMCGTKKEEIR